MANSNGALTPASIDPASSVGSDGQFSIIKGFSRVSGAVSQCHGFWHDASLVLPSALFIAYLGFRSARNIKKLRRTASLVVIAHYLVLWLAAVLNLAWSSLQAWQCLPGKDGSWNLLSLFTTSAMLCLEISIITFLLQDNYVSGLETLAHTFKISGLIVGADMVFKAICIFAFDVPLFMNNGNMHQGKLGIWLTYKVTFSAIYGYILFVHYSKWRDKLPPRPAFYNYVVVMFTTHAIALFFLGLSVMGMSFALWIYNLDVMCYHSFYLPFLYITFLADFFQEEDWLLDTAYYAEMRDAGFFDAEWD